MDCFSVKAQPSEILYVVVVMAAENLITANKMLIIQTSSSDWWKKIEQIQFVLTMTNDYWITLRPVRAASDVKQRRLDDVQSARLLAVRRS